MSRRAADEGLEGVDVTALGSHAPTTVRDVVVVEEPLVVRVRGRDDLRRTLTTTMRTPGDDHALAVGLCLSEGVLPAPGALLDVQACPHEAADGVPGSIVPGNTMLVTVDVPTVTFDDDHRHTLMSSACGVCGRTSIDDVGERLEQAPRAAEVSVDLLLDLPERLHRQQDLFGASGGLHAVALFDLDGTFLDLREDVGRHNAFDKVVGHALRRGQLPLDDRIVVLSGRASYELLAKSAVAGIAVVVAIGAPSSLAVRVARRFGITLLGFVRDGRGNAYSGLDRLAGVATDPNGVALEVVP